MQSPILYRLLLAIVALIAGFTALAHLSCIVLGPQCYEIQMAPPIIVQSAVDGTWIAPLGTVFAAVLFLMCCAYALAEANWSRSLPLQRLASLTIGILCVIRGILPIQLYLRIPERVDNIALWYAIVWLIAGVCMLIGRRYHRIATTA